MQRKTRINSWSERSEERNSNEGNMLQSVSAIYVTSFSSLAKLNAGLDKVLLQDKKKQQTDTERN